MIFFFQGETPMPTKEKKTRQSAAENGKAAKKNDRNGRKTQKKTPSVQLAERQDGFPIVGVGTSAGGIRALEGLLRHMPGDIPFAMVIVQHLDPKRESMVPSILSRVTGIPVRQARDGEKIEIGNIYVKPPDKDIVMIDRRIKLRKQEEGTVRLPIDLFFRSLASTFGEKSIGIILSGAGSDGSLGAKEIQGAGGLVIVQDEKQAEHSGMPRSALDSMAVDMMLPVEKMGEQLIQYTLHPMLFRSDLEEEKGESQQLRNIQELLQMIRIKTGHDFTQYKLSTVRRRIARRMAVNRIESISEYARFVRKSPDEAEELFEDLVVSVTSFFRDPQVFAKIQKSVIPEIISDKTPESLVRIWVPGCASGEEAYSLAMLFMEEVERIHSYVKVKIFATDINHHNIERAREGLFRDNIAADVTPERLQRFFDKRADGVYKIKGSIRELIVFSVHDITRDAPLVRMDLVSCRNLLIYMNSELQKKVIPVLHYSLTPGGMLVLGTSEGVGDFHEIFQTVDKKNKIFRKMGDEPSRYWGYIASLSQNGMGGDPAQKMGVQPEGRQESIPISELVEEAFSEMGPPGVIVDQSNSVVYFIGDTTPFLFQPPGMPTVDVIRMADEGLRHHLIKAIEDVRKTHSSTAVEGVHLVGKEPLWILNIRVAPIRRVKGYLVITFERHRTPGAYEAGGKSFLNEVDVEGEDILKERLRAAKQQLQASIEEFETTNEELKSANEELQANNEELQSTNEELESSKEELQSTNEELETTNLELHRKNEELLRAEDDARNLFSSTDVGTLFLDRRLMIKRFTPPATRLFNLIDKDVGRPISDITSSLSYPAFLEDVQDVLDNLNKKELDLQTKDGRWFSVRLLPYRNSQNVIDGVIITFGDVTRLKSAETAAKEAQLAAEGIMQTVPHPLVVLDHELRVRSANPAFYRMLRISEKEAVGRVYTDLQKGKWSHLELEQGLRDLVSRGGKNREYEYSDPNGGDHRIKVTACKVEGRDNRPVVVLLMFQE